MKLRATVLALLMLPMVSDAKYKKVGNTIKIYQVKDYSGAFLEGLLGACALFYGSSFYAATRNRSGLGVSSSASLVSGLVAAGGFAALGDAIRRACASANVGLEISAAGIACCDSGLVPWNDITRIECVSFTTVQYGRPFTNGYQINLSTTESVPLEIDGATLSESMNTLLTFMRKFYKGEITTGKEVVQDMTPRPTNVNVNNNNDDLANLANIIQAGFSIWHNR